MNKELKPCPFCGGDVVLNKFDDPWAVFKCVNKNEIACFVGVSFNFVTSEEEAIKAWNRRPEGE